MLPVGGGDDPDFSPVELLLAALAGCAAIDVDLITGKRAQPLRSTFAPGDKIRDENGNHLVNLKVTFEVEVTEGEAGDKARAVLPRAMAQTRDRLCTVTRTVALGAPVEFGPSKEDQDTDVMSTGTLGVPSGPPSAVPWAAASSTSLMPASSIVRRRCSSGPAGWGRRR